MTAATELVRLYLDLPSGQRLGPFDTEAAMSQAFVLHEAAAVSEGLCPWHAKRLHTVDGVNGICPPCGRRWWADAQQVGWELVDLSGRAIYWLWPYQ